MRASAVIVQSQLLLVASRAASAESESRSEFDFEFECTRIFSSSQRRGWTSKIRVEIGLLCDHARACGSVTFSSEHFRIENGAQAQVRLGWRS